MHLSGSRCPCNRVVLHKDHYNIWFLYAVDQVTLVVIYGRSSNPSYLVYFDGLNILRYTKDEYRSKQKINVAEYRPFTTTLFK